MLTCLDVSCSSDTLANRRLETLAGSVGRMSSPLIGVSILCKENVCLQHKQLQKCWRRLRVRQSCFEVGQKMVRALSVRADAFQFETTCVVRLVRRAEELGAVSEVAVPTSSPAE